MVLKLPLICDLDVTYGNALASTGFHRVTDEQRHAAAIAPEIYLWYQRKKPTDTKTKDNLIELRVISDVDDTLSKHWTKLGKKLVRSKTNPSSIPYLCFRTQPAESPVHQAINDLKIVNSVDKIPQGYIHIQTDLLPEEVFLCFSRNPKSGPEVAPEGFNAEHLLRGEWIDVLGPEDKWLIAYIVDIENGNFRIHFCNSTPDTDEFIAATSARIAPIGTHTKLASEITSPTSSCCSLSPLQSKMQGLSLWNVEQQDLTEEMAKLSRYNSDEGDAIVDSEGHTRQYWAEYLPAIVDKCMESTYANDEIVLKVNVFLQAVLACAVERLSKSKVDSYVLQIMLRILDIEDETQRFYSHQSRTMPRLPLHEANQGVQIYVNEPTDADALLVSPYFSANVDFFGRCGGFEAITSHMGSSEVSIPELHMLIKIIAATNSCLAKEFKLEYVSRFLESSFNQILSLDNAIIAEEWKLIHDILKSLGKLELSIETEPNCRRNRERFELDYAEKLIFCFEIEQQKEGLALLKHLAVRTLRRSKQEDTDAIDASLITYEELLEWILKSSIIEILLGDVQSLERNDLEHLTTSAEVVRDLLPVLELLCTRQKFTKELLQMLWDYGFQRNPQTSEEQSKEQQKVVLEMVSRLWRAMGTYLLREVSLILERSQIPYDQHIVRFIASFVKFCHSKATAPVNGSVSKKSANLSEEERTLCDTCAQIGLLLLYEALSSFQEASGAASLIPSKELQRLTLDLFCGTLVDNSMEYQTGRYIQQCMDSIQENMKKPDAISKSSFSIAILNGIIRKKSKRSSAKRWMEELNEKYSLLDLLIDHLGTVRSGELTMQRELLRCLELIFHVATISLTKITYDQVNGIFKALNDFRSLFYRWLHHLMKKNMVQEDTLRKVFIGLMCKSRDDTQVSTYEFDCFKKCFCLANSIVEINGSLRAAAPKETTVATGLRGFSELVDMAVITTDSDVETKANAFIIDVLCNSGTSILTSYRYREFLQDCKRRLFAYAAQSPSSDTKGITRLLRVLASVLEKTKKITEPVDLHVQITDHSKSSTSSSRPKSIRIACLSPNSTVGELRHEISKVLKHPQNQIRLVNKMGIQLAANDVSLNASGFKKDGIAILLSHEAPDTVVPVMPASIDLSSAISEGKSAIDKLHAEFVNDPRLFGILYREFLSTSSEVASGTCQLLSNLPFNERLVAQICDEGACGLTWKEIFDTSALYQLLYRLRILYFIIAKYTTAHDPATQSSASALSSGFTGLTLEDWFLASSGYDHLCQVLFKWDIEVNFRQAPTVDCLKVILQIIAGVYPYLPEEHQNAEQLMTKLVLVMDRVTPSLLVSDSRSTSHANVMIHLIRAILKCFSGFATSGASDLFSPALDRILTTALFQSHSAPLQKIILRFIKYLTRREPQVSKQLNLQQRCLFFLRVLSHDEVGTCGQLASEYYEIVYSVLQTIPVSKLEPPEVHRLFLVLLRQMESYETRELSLAQCSKSTKAGSAYQDNGLQLLLESLVHLCQHAKADLENHLSDAECQRVMLVLCIMCLFGSPTSYRSISAIPKAKHPNTRQLCLRLLDQVYRLRPIACLGTLLECCSLHHYPRVMQGVPDTTSLLGYYEPPPRVLSAASILNLNESLLKKFENQTFVGLVNLGCTCYMNSIMQTLFMIRRFRRQVLMAIDTSSSSAPGEEQTLLSELQLLFANLQESSSVAYNPQSFIKALRTWDNQQINVTMQQDVSEFLTLFFQQFDSYVNGSENENLLKKSFGGVFSNELLDQDQQNEATPSHYSERSEPFYFLSLQIRKCKSLEDSLKSWIAPEIVDYSWNKSGSDPSKTLKSVCIKELPEHLILHLKRFEFDFDSMEQNKVHDRFEFPVHLNMLNYTKEGLCSPVRTNSKQVQHADAYYQYQLISIIVHDGTAHSGHYYAYIRSPDEEGSDANKWLEFNDTVVAPFDPAAIPAECFGGAEEKNPKKQKTRSAFMLVYSRCRDPFVATAASAHTGDEAPEIDGGNEEQALVAEQGTGRLSFWSTALVVLMVHKWKAKIAAKQHAVEDLVEQHILTCSLASRDHVLPEWIYQRILDQNMLVWQRNFIFQTTYSQFILQLISHSMILDPPADVRAHLQEQALVLCLGFLFGAAFGERSNPQGLLLNEKELSKWQQILEQLIPLNGPLMIQFFDHLQMHPRIASDFVQKWNNPLATKVFQQVIELGCETLLKANAKCKIVPKMIQNSIFLILVELSAEEIQDWVTIINQYCRCGLKECQLALEALSLPQIIKSLITAQASSAQREGPTSLPPAIVEFLALVICCRKPPAFAQSHSEAFHDLSCHSPPTIQALVNPGFIRLLVQSTPSYCKSRKFFGQIFGHLAYANEELSNLLLQQISTGIEEGDFDTIKTYFRCFRLLCNADSIQPYPDPLATSRLNEGMVKLVAVIASQQSFFKATEVSIRMLVRLAKSNMAVYQWLDKHKGSWQWIMKWIQDHRGTSGLLQQNKTKFIKPLSKRTSGLRHHTKQQTGWQNLPPMRKDVLNHITTTLDALERLIQQILLRDHSATGEPTPSPLTYDSDEDPESIIDCAIEVQWANNKWYRGRVKSYNHQTKQHFVVYDDGDERRYVLKDKTFTLERSGPRTEV